MILLYFLFFIAFSNAEDFPSEPDENEHEASVNMDQMLWELDGKCLESTRQMMSRMKDCFLRSDGSIADMESISACTARLEETVHKALNQKYHPGIHDPGKSQDFN